MQSHSRSLILVLAVLALAPDASAQIGRSAPASSDLPVIAEPRDGSFAQFRLGSLVFTPDLALTEIGLDTNVFREDTDRKTDFTFTLMPNVQVFFGTNSFRLRTTVGSHLIYYARTKSERSVSPLVRVELQQKLGRAITLFSDNSSSLIRDRPTPEIYARVRHRAFSTSNGIQFTPTHRTFFRFGGAYSQGAYGDSAFRGVRLRETLDYTSSSFGLSAGYRLTPYTSASAGGVLTRMNFVNRPERDGTLRSSYVGFGFTDRALFSGTARVGYTDFASRTGLTTDFSGVTADVDLTARVGQTVQFGLGGARELMFSYSLGAPYYISNTVDVSATKRLFERFDLAAGAINYRLEYPAYLTTAPIDDRYRVYNASIGVHIKKTRFGLVASYWKRPASRGREGTTWGIAISRGRFSVNNRGVFMGG